MYINPCNCGNSDVTVKCTSGSHYESHWVRCDGCGKEGQDDMYFHDAIREWNKAIADEQK